MSSHANPIAFTRAVAVTALLGAAMLATPLIAARADTATKPANPIVQPQNQAAAPAASKRAETVEQRIASLHRSLKITTDQESKWNDVAQAMRENAAALQKLDAQRTSQAPQNMTALQDLNTYRAYAQAHIDGLKNLTSSFETLYKAMPDAQKKIADQVFHNFGRTGAPARS